MTELNPTIPAIPPYETAPLPPNVEALENLTSPAFIEQRQQWLSDQTRGIDDDVVVGHVARLLGQTNRQRDLSRQVRDANNVSEHDYQRRFSDSLQETTYSIFGAHAVEQFRHCEQAQYELPRGRVVFWGREGKQVLNILLTELPSIEDGIDRNHTPPPKRSKPTRDEYVDYLTQKIFLPFQYLGSLVNEDTPRIVVELDAEEPYTVPLSRVVSAGGFDSWAGAGYRGQEDKSYDKNDKGEKVIGQSIDAIRNYAERETAIPPVEGIDAYIQPNGKVVCAAPVSTHRTAAAIARGQETIAVEGRITIYRLRENVV